MTKRIISGLIALTLLASLGLAGACTEAVQAKTGTIEVRVTDAPPGYEIISIVVTVSEEEGEGVQVHKAGDDGEGEWITIGILEGANPFDLLELVGLEEVLAVGEEVDAGKYTQIRMNIVSVLVTYLAEGSETPVTVEATLPSGELKFVRPFDVVAEETTTLLLDFIAGKSVVVTGATQSEEAKVIFKPAVKLSIEQGGKPHELASVEGTISDVNTEASTVSIIPDGGTEDDTIVLDVNPQTEITLDGDEEATLEDLVGLGEGNSVTASYYLNNLKATQIDALSSPSP